MKNALRRALRVGWKYRRLVAAVGLRLAAAALAKRKR